MDAFAFHPYPETSATGPASRTRTARRSASPTTRSSSRCSARRSTGPRSAARRCRSCTTSSGSRRQIPAGEGARSTPAPSRRRRSRSTRRRRRRFYVQAMQMTFCQPTVLGLLLFHVQDEPALAALAVGRVLRRRHAENVALARCAARRRRRAPRHRRRLPRPAADAQGGVWPRQAGQDGREGHPDMLTRLHLHRHPRRPPPHGRGGRPRRRRRSSSRARCAPARTASRRRATRRAEHRAARHGLRLVPLALALALAGCGGSQAAEAASSAPSRMRPSGRRDPDGADAVAHDAGFRAIVLSAVWKRGASAAADLPPLRRAVDAAVASECDPVLAVYQLSSSTPPTGAARGVRRLRRRARAGAARGARR